MHARVVLSVWYMGQVLTDVFTSQVLVAVQYIYIYQNSIYLFPKVMLISLCVQDRQTGERG